MRVLLDTNVLISGILFRGVPRTLFDLAIRGELELVTTPPLLDELEEILVRRLEFPLQLGRAVLTEVETLAEVVVPGDVPAVSRDPDDVQVLAVGVVGQVEAIVTGDKDLLVLRSHRGIPIIRPTDLLNLLPPESNDG